MKPSWLSSDNQLLGQLGQLCCPIASLDETTPTEVGALPPLCSPIVLSVLDQGPGHRLPVVRGHTVAIGDGSGRVVTIRLPYTAFGARFARASSRSNRLTVRHLLLPLPSPPRAFPELKT